MAYVQIHPIKDKTHLRNSFEYILNMEKTNDRYYTDAYKSVPEPKDAEYFFAQTYKNRVMNKGNNLAWHIEQSFSPDDNIAPEEALEIGMELMKRMYPNHEYVIATHIDKEHIHNHIIVNSVNFIDYHKLVSNKYSLAHMRKLSDDICKEHGLSIIKSTDKKQREKLKEAMDTAIENSSDFSEFLTNMQEAGYNINCGKYISFKNKEMGRYIRSTTISLDYTEEMIKYRIKSKKPAQNSKRNVYDDKIAYKSKRKILQMEIDASIKKSETFDEFLQDMKRKNFEIKQGAHLAFKGDNFERFIRVDSIKDNCKYTHYTEEMLRYRIEYREEYEMLMEHKVGRLINKKGMYGGLDNWAAGVNSNIMTRMVNFCTENLNDFYDYMYKNGYLTEHGYLNEADEKKYGKDMGDNKHWLGTKKMYAVFMKYGYRVKEGEILNLQQEVDEINSKIRNIINAKKAIETYWDLKPLITSYKKMDKENLKERFNEDEVKYYNSNIEKWNNNIIKIESIKEEYGTLSISALNENIKILQQEKRELQNDIVRKKLEFENWEDVKFNFEAKHGFDLKLEDANKYLEEFVSDCKALKEYNDIKKEKKEARIQAIKNLFGLK